MNNIKELLVRLEKAQREYPETHVLLGQTRTAVVALQDKVEELTKVMEAARDDLLIRGDNDSQGCRVVNMSATTWDNFCDAIDKAALSQES